MAKGCIRTASGIKFNILKPDLASIDIEDIAHHLSQLGRYNGACPKLYTVGEHCVRGARYLKKVNADPKLQLAFLLHDAAEAYIKDMPTPLKVEMPGYQKAESVVADSIMDVFGVLDVWKGPKCFALIDFVDHEIMYHWEIRDFWGGPAEWQDTAAKEAYEASLAELPSERIKPWSPHKAERQYLMEFYRLMHEIAV